MEELKKVEENLLQRGYSVKCCSNAKEAAQYLDSRIDQKSVGFGGSVTLDELGIYELLSTHNEVLWKWKDKELDHKQTAQTQIYLTSANALARTGEIINIDGAGNRVASTLFGHEKVYFVIGKNKLAPTYEEALWRARNISAPKNAQRLHMNTPCAVKGDRCYDCKSSDRICRALVTLWEPMMRSDMEVVLVDEDLGY